MCEQTGEEIDWDRCPPDMEDFPEAIITAIQIYNSLGDRIYPEIGYVGKDFTNLSLLFDLHYIKDTIQKEYLTELLLILDSQQIKESPERMKAEYNKIKKR